VGSGGPQTPHPEDSAFMVGAGTSTALIAGYSLGFQQWANSFRAWLIPITLNERVCLE
jgi:hypothetical protein